MRINLLVGDPDALVERAVANGAVLVAPIADQTYGLRQGRLADPFGHHWLIGRPLKNASGDWGGRVIASSRGADRSTSTASSCNSSATA